MTGDVLVPHDQMDIAAEVQSIFTETFEEEATKARAVEAPDVIVSNVPDVCLLDVLFLESRSQENLLNDVFAESSWNFHFTNFVTEKNSSFHGSIPLKRTSAGARRTSAGARSRSRTEQDRGASEALTAPKLRKRRSAERCADGIPLSMTALTSNSNSGIPRNDGAKVAISQSAFRGITNTTYLRKMPLSRDDAVRLFPEFKSSVDYVFSSSVNKHGSSGNFQVETSVSIQDAEGRCWSVALECLRTAAQRHIRLNRGWSEVCRANGLSVGKRFRLERWVKLSSKDAVVTLSTV